FVSYSKSLVSGLTGPQNDFFRANVFLYDAVNDSMLILSDVGSTPVTGNGDSRHPSISDDGRYIAFESRATNLIPSASVFPTSNVVPTDIFASDRADGTNALVSGATASASATADNYSDSPSLSMDGSAIVFRSTASNLVAGQSGPPGSNIFFFGHQHGSTSIT